MQKTAQEILAVIESHRDTIKKFGVRRLGLFGSHVRGEGKESSDLDFVVDFEDKTFDNYMDLKFFLEDLFNCPVDLVMIEAIKPRLKPVILNETVYAQGF
ncbi:MAG: nucleotidyltransferase family protein [Thermodesulfobacteriota bacterium]